MVSGSERLIQAISGASMLLHLTTLLLLLVLLVIENYMLYKDYLGEVRGVPRNKRIGWTPIAIVIAITVLLVLTPFRKSDSGQLFFWTVSLIFAVLTLLSLIYWHLKTRRLRNKPTTPVVS